MRPVVEAFLVGLGIVAVLLLLVGMQGMDGGDNEWD